MPELVFQPDRQPFEYPASLHILTYAEEGFSPLNIHSRRFGVDRSVLRSFADAVNKAGEVGTLVPQAPISAIPRPCIRDTSDEAPVRQYLQEFLRSYALHIDADTLLLDFRTPRLQRHVRNAIVTVFGALEGSGIGSVIVIDP